MNTVDFATTVNHVWERLAADWHLLEPGGLATVGISPIYCSGELTAKSDNGAVVTFEIVPAVGGVRVRRAIRGRWLCFSCIPFLRTRKFSTSVAAAVAATLGGKPQVYEEIVRYILRGFP